MIGEFDAAAADALDDAAIDAFRRDGLLLIRNLVGGAELDVLREDTQPVVDDAAARAAALTEAPVGLDVHDFAYRMHRGTGRVVAYRQEHVISHVASCHGLLGHPFIAASMRRLIGPSATPTWDSMVFKSAGQGAVIPWHRDDDVAPHLRSHPICNIDIYLDPADSSNTLWAVPGSHHWDHDRAATEVARLNESDEWAGLGAVNLPMAPGDALLHDIGVLHGSPASQSALRRVVYFEFRGAEDIVGRSHNVDYVAAKQQLWERTVEARRAGSAVTEPAPRFGHGDFPPERVTEAAR